MVLTRGRRWVGAMTGQVEKMPGLTLGLQSLRRGIPGEEQVLGKRSRVVVDMLRVRHYGGSSGKARRSLGSRYRSAQN